MAVASGSAKLPEIAKKISHSRAALIVLGLGLVISFAAWRVVEQRVSSEATYKFQHKVAQAEVVIDRYL